MCVLLNACFFPLCIFIPIITNVIVNVEGTPPEVLMNFEERVEFHGYPVEIHQVTTEDDYILHMYRIPHGLEKAKHEPKNKSVVFIVHGMGGAAHNFIALGKDHAPAYYFANRSLDVWLICTRGVDCQNPQKHKKYDWNKDREYWNYSSHEIGLYDVPACIDYIIRVTGQQKIFYIGHSSGGLEFFVMTTEKPGYNDKIKINFNYGQAALITNIEYPVATVSISLLRIFKTFIYSLDVQELPTRNLQLLIISLSRHLCADHHFKKVCFYAIELIDGTLSTLIDMDIAEIVFSNMPRVSLRQLMHYADNHGGEFRKFDWGTKKNMKIYGQKKPPVYNMSACTARNAFFYGAKDALSTPEDNLRTMASIPNTIFEHKIGPRFTHLDFIFAKNSTFLVYEQTVKLIKEYDDGIMRPKITRNKTQQNCISNC